MIQDCSREMEAFEEYLTGCFPNSDRLSDEVSRAVFQSGGKRLRPRLTIMFSMTGEDYDRAKAFSGAASVEMLHTATLVHDDIIDDADNRRGVPTVNIKYGNHMAVYVGDYLLLKAAGEMLKLGSYDENSVKRIHGALSSICAGEIDQYFSRGHIESVLSYLRRIRKKTALMFGAACALGAYNSGRGEDAVDCAFRFGTDFGTAFQIRDDILNFGKAEQSDKPVLNDLTDGILTLPVILAVENNPELSELLKRFLDRPSDPDTVAREIKRSGGVERSRTLMRRYAQRARKQLKRFGSPELEEQIELMLENLYA